MDNILQKSISIFININIYDNIMENKCEISFDGILSHN